MQKVAGKDGVWRLEPHEKLLGVRLFVYDDAVPALPDGTKPEGVFGVVGGRALRPKPASGGMCRQKAKCLISPCALWRT